MPETVRAEDGYDSDAPFEQGKIHDGVLYTAGQVPTDPETGAIVGDGIEEQTHRTLDNLEAILRAAGTSFENALRVGVYLTDMDDYDGFNRVYRDRMPAPRPARTTVEVADLAIPVRVEIDMIAAIE
ncbi:MAG: RidA family protein [Haloarculaceae archaeon]